MVTPRSSSPCSRSWASRWSPCRACTWRWTAPSTHVCLEASSIEPVGASRLDELLRVFLEGFEIPEDFAPEFAALYSALLDDGLLHVLATLDGHPVAGGSVWVTGSTAGLYNISTLEQSRGRGIGYAVTAALMNLGRDLGCTHAVLHASESGRPVYERLGFTEVCQVPQFVWMPPSLEPAPESSAG